MSMRRARFAREGFTASLRANLEALASETRRNPPDVGYAPASIGAEIQVVRVPSSFELFVEACEELLYGRLLQIEGTVPIDIVNMMGVSAVLLMAASVLRTRIVHGDSDETTRAYETYALMIVTLRNRTDWGYASNVEWWQRINPVDGRTWVEYCACRVTVTNVNGKVLSVSDPDYKVFESMAFAFPSDGFERMHTPGTPSIAPVRLNMVENPHYYPHPLKAPLGISNHVMHTPQNEKYRTYFHVHPLSYEEAQRVFNQHVRPFLDDGWYGSMPNEQLSS